MRLADSTVARRARRANGSRIDGRTRLTARTMCAPSRIGKNHGMVAIVGRAARSGRRTPGPRARPSRLRRFGRRREPAGPRTPPGPRPSRSTKIPDASSEPPGRSSSRSSGASATRTPAIRLARTTSNDGPEPDVAGCPARAEPPDDGVAAGVGEGRLDRDRVGVEAQRRPRARASARRSPGSRSRSRRRGPGARRRTPRSASASIAARHSRVVGCRPVPNAMPGSSASTTSPGRAGGVARSAG